MYNFDYKGEENMEFKIDICSYCFGSGKLKVMQSAMVNNTTSIRYKDKELKCKYCNGTGVKASSQYK